MSGKGDKPRPVNKERYDKEYERIFSPLPRNPICDVLSEACGYELRDEKDCPHKFAEQIIIPARGDSVKFYKCSDCGAEFEEK